MGARDDPPKVLFEITRGFDVADLTTVYPFLNGNDAKSGLPRGLPESFSMAIGVVHPGQSSKIHVHPVVTQVTMVLDGNLEARLGGESMPERRAIALSQNQAVLVRPRTFLQLVNPTVLPCRTLYVVGPAYVAHYEQEQATYEDAVTVEETWDELAALHWKPTCLQDTDDAIWQRRAAALERVRDLQADGAASTGASGTP